MPLDFENVAFDADDDSVGLGGDVPVVYPSASDPGADNVILYSHGRSVRLRVPAGEERLLQALAEADIPRDFAGWRTLRDKPGGWRQQMAGAVWLGGRRPGYGRSAKNKQSALALLNRRWRTDLYGIGAEVNQKGAFIDLAFVCNGDTRRYLHDRLGLTPDDYEVDYYLAAERYFVLQPHEARRLARELGGVERTGTGREAAKEFLARTEVPISIRKRAKAKATITVYRIGPGATAPYKVEVGLHMKSNRRGQFSADDIGKLDHVLLHLVAEHDLHPIPKPTKWQPKLPSRAGLAPRDVCLRRLRPTAWRGGRVSQADRKTASKCNTFAVSELGVSERPDDGNEPSARISTYGGFPTPCSSSSSSSLASSVSATPSSEPTVIEWAESEVHPDFSIYSRSDASPSSERVDRTPVITGGCPFQATVDEIERMPGLSEVIFNPNSDPGPFLDRLVDRFGSRLGIGLLALDPSYVAPHARQVAAEHPLADGHDVVVLVVDVSLTALISSAFLSGTDEQLQEGPWFPGPFARPRGGFDDPDGTSNWWRAVAGLLADLTEEARRLVEREGTRVILVTQDARPVRGRGPINKHQESRDTRVRSIIGNAGRRSCHQRFFVERRLDGDVRKIVLWKDETEGLVGRTVYMNPRSEPRWRRRRQDHQVVTHTWIGDEPDHG